MDTHSTYDDVNLILRLYDLRREEKIRKARNWFISSFKARTMDEFNALCPQGSEENAYFRMVVTYWDMAASFVTAGVLNQKLFIQSNRELLFIWERVRDFVQQWRDAAKDPTILRNLESVGNAFADWLKSESPEGYNVFAARVRGAAS